MSESLLYHDTCHHGIYGLSCEEFNELHAYAEGRCQICRTPESETKRGRLCIDHLGEYGARAVRGLLCDRCNTLMGRVDARRLSGSLPTGVYNYRYNAWFLRRLHPWYPMAPRVVAPEYPWSREVEWFWTDADDAETQEAS